MGIDHNKISFGTYEMSVEELPKWYRIGRVRDDQNGFPTDGIESLTSRLLVGGVEGTLILADANRWLHQICVWAGGYFRSVVNPLAEDDPLLFESVVIASKTVRDFLDSSTDFISSEVVSKILEELMECFMRLSGVGVTAASAFVRFLLPDYAAMINEKVARLFGRSTPNIKDFISWSSECGLWAAQANMTGVERPHVNLSPVLTSSSRSKALTWRPADIDLALWAYANKVDNDKLWNPPSKITEEFMAAPGHGVTWDHTRSGLITARCDCGDWRDTNERYDRLIVSYRSHL